MAKEKMTIRQFLADYFPKRNFEDRSVDTACDDGWYDWFCKDHALAGKTKNLGSKLRGISKSKKFDIDTTYVFFKNNCSMVGLYDDFRICDIETGGVIYTIIPKDVGTKKAEVWGMENGFKEPLISGSWKEIKNWFLS